MLAAFRTAREHENGWMEISAELFTDLARGEQQSCTAKLRWQIRLANLPLDLASAQSFKSR